MHHHKQIESLRNKEKVLIKGKKTKLLHAGKGSCIRLPATTLRQGVRAMAPCCFASCKKKRAATFYPMQETRASVNKQ
jgi:hypothetical protein